jgi:predicted methyltransferase
MHRGSVLITLSYIQVEPIISARRAGQPSVTTSPDLGLTTAEVGIEAAGARFPNQEFISWEDLQTICDSETACFEVLEDSIQKAEAFSEVTNRYCSLFPTRLAPTLLLSGIPMHRVKGIDPYHDTLNKIACLRPVVGQVLDTATGLGYTAIEAAKTASRVVTIELDPAVLQVARQNPWSQALFDHPRIIQLMGDSYEKVMEFEEGSFSRIIHDPPTFSLAGDLYSGEFYRRLFRVLKNGGLLFHYIGNLDSDSGRRVVRGVAQRLQEAGFNRVTYKYEAFGLVAQR